MSADASRVNGESPASDLQALLATPDTLALLGDIVAHLDVVHVAVMTLDGFLRRADTIVENVSGGVGELRALGDRETLEALGKIVKATPDLGDALEKLRPALRSDALNRLLDPKALESLAKITEHAEFFAFATEAIQGFLGRADQIVEAAGMGIKDLHVAARSGIGEVAGAIADMQRLLPGLQGLIRSTIPLVESGAIDALARSNVFSPDVLRTIGTLGDALTATRVREAENPTSIGLFGLMKLIRDPDVQRSLGFFSSFLKDFGKRLDA